MFLMNERNQTQHRPFTQSFHSTSEKTFSIKQQSCLPNRKGGERDEKVIKNGICSCIVGEMQLSGLKNEMRL